MLRDYDAYVFPFHPIITPAEAREAVCAMHHDLEARAFVYALTAVTISLALTSTVPGNEDAAAILDWLRRSTAAFPGVLSVDDITIRRIVAVEFIHVALGCLGRFEPAYYYLRQSVSMVEALRVDDPHSLTHFSASERAKRQRLYALIWVHERYFALSHYHAPTLTTEPLISAYASMEDTISPQIAHGFDQIVSLFRHVDGDMIRNWLALSDDATSVDPVWIQEKHQELESDPAGDLESISVICFQFFQTGLPS